MGVPLPQQTIARIEAGKRSVRLAEAAAIAHALGAELSELMSGPGEIGDAPEQLAQAVDRLQRVRVERADTDLAQEAAESHAAAIAGEVMVLREEEARLEATVEQLRAAVEQAADNGGAE